jgi:hypothetical protein
MNCWTRAKKVAVGRPADQEDDDTEQKIVNEGSSSIQND